MSKLEEIIENFGLQECENPIAIAKVCFKLEKPIHTAFKELCPLIIKNPHNQWELTIENCIRRCHGFTLSELQIKAAAEFTFAVILKYGVANMYAEADKHTAKGIHYCELSLVPSEQSMG